MVEKAHNKPINGAFSVADIGGFAGYVFNRFVEDRGWRMAAGLSYTSLLAIVPLTAIAFSMLAAFPVFENAKEQFQDAVFTNLLPDSANAMRQYFDGFVQNTTSLSAVGIIALALTAVLLLGTIEADINSIFRVKQARNLASKLLVFWAMLTLGPLLLGASFSLSTYFFAATQWMNVDILKGPIGLLTGLVPTLIIIVLFTMFYFAIPNRPVRITTALVGGISAGLVFGLLRKGFGWYVATFPSYQNVYGALSVIPIFLIWMYLSWTVVILGAVLTASVSDWRNSGGNPGDSNLRPGQRTVLALRVLSVLFEGAQAGRRINRSELLARIGGGEAQLDQVVELLQAAEFVDQSARGGWVLSRDLDTATLHDLGQAMRLGIGRSDLDSTGNEGWEGRLKAKMGEMHDAQKTASNVSLRSILLAHEEGESTGL
jgi:membrane protein